MPCLMGRIGPGAGFRLQSPDMVQWLCHVLAPSGAPNGVGA